MIISNKVILLISPEPWNHIFVSKHHYAISLASSGNHVYFLNPPSKKFSIEKSYYENLFVVDYCGFPKGIRFYPKFFQTIIVSSLFNRIENKCETNFDIVWSFDNSVFFDFSFLPKQTIKISHIVDQNQDFNFGVASKTADICLGVIPEIVERQKNFNPKSYLIPHGVNTREDSPVPVKLPGSNSMKALYIGNMNMAHLDWELVVKLITNFREVDFIFVGPGEERLEKLISKNKNLFASPKVPSEEVSSYLKSADILLVLYNEEYKLNYASPHKMLEYLYSGKPIIGTFMPEYFELQQKELILMAKSHTDFLTHFRVLLDNYQIEMQPEKIAGRKRFAEAHSYGKLLKKIEGLISAI
jgi:glycosyltransferase involved in cell wall biosynthesis